MRTRRKRQAFRLAMILLFAAVVLAGLLLFRVRKIVVYGNSHHTSSEISSGLMSGLMGKNTLYLLWSNRDGSIPDTLPYLESMQITMKSPFSIEVSVTEKELAGYVYNGEYAYFDNDGIIELISDQAYDDIPIITGASIGDIVLYQKLPTESSAQLRTILNLLELFQYNGLSVEEIRFSEDSDITVFTGGVQAMLGQDEYLEEKVANLKAVLNTDSMEGVTAGTIHLETFTGKEPITYRASETESETETESVSSSVDTGVSGGVVAGAGTQENSGTTGEGDGTGTDSSDGNAADSGEEDGNSDSADGTGTDDDSSDDEESGADLMVFNSSGQLVYNVHVRNGVVVDSSGNEVPGCTVNEDGNVVDAYMNEIDPDTGDLLNGTVN